MLCDADPELAAVYPPTNASQEDLFDAVAAAITRQDVPVARFLRSPPQTNEAARSAVLLPGFLRLAQDHPMPLVLSELGSSAGLNQNWHRFRYDYGSWAWGDPSSPVRIRCDWPGPPGNYLQKVDVRASRGCDIATFPIDRGADRMKLRSYVWPDQPARHQRLNGALRIAADHPPKVDRARACDWIGKRLAERKQGRLHVIFHTIMWQYMPAEEQLWVEDLIREAGARASRDAPLAWLRLETDGDPDGAALHVTTWSGLPDDGKTRLLARADFHGRWIKPAIGLAAE